MQSVLAKNYPKVRKGLFVFPVNWFVQLFWDTLLRPLLSTLQPDIEDKVSLAARVARGGAGAALAGSRGASADARAHLLAVWRWCLWAVRLHICRSVR